MGVRKQGQMGSADPPGKMDEKLKSENMQKEQFSEWVGGDTSDDWLVKLMMIIIVIIIAPFRSQFF